MRSVRRAPRSEAPGHISPRWSGSRVARTLKVTEFIDRLGVPLSPVVLTRLLPVVYGVATTCEVLVCAFLVSNAAPRLAQNIPKLTAIEGADGTYFLFAFAVIPALIDVLAHITRLATSTRIESDPFVTALPALGVSAKDALWTFIVVPLTCRWIVMWSPLVIVALYTENGYVCRLSLGVLWFGIALYAASAYRRLLLFARLPNPDPLNWFLTVLTVLFPPGAGVVVGSLLASIGTTLGAPGSVDVETPGDVAVPLAPVLSLMTRPAGFILSGMLALGMTALFLFGIHRVLVVSPKIYSMYVARDSTTQRGRRGIIGQSLNRLLFPIVGERWVRVMWNRPSTMGTCFALCTAIGIETAIEDPFPDLLPLFVVIPALTAPLSENFRSVDPRENLLRYRFHVEVGKFKITGVVLRLTVSIALGLLPILLSASAWLIASGLSPAIGLTPLIAFLFVRFFFANSPMGAGAMVTLMILCEFGISYALAFISVLSPMSGWCALICACTATLYLAYSRLKTVKR